MNKVEMAARLQALSKEYLASLKKQEQMRDKRNMELSDRQRQKLAIDQDWQAIHTLKLEHLIHKVVVDMDICDPYEPEYYSPTELHPSAWQEERYQRPVPEKIERMEQ